MREINIEFQEQYKRLDKLCKDMYGTGEGVSAYIKSMEETTLSWSRSVYHWDAVYKQLKHIRWMRNQLAHEVSIDSDFCDFSDIEWVKGFYKSIFQAEDPLALVDKAKKAEAQRTITLPKRSYVDKTPFFEKSEMPIEAVKPRKSLWNRIKSKLKDWVS